MYPLVVNSNINSENGAIALRKLKGEAIHQKSKSPVNNL